jgi:hypothetical protein
MDMDRVNLLLVAYSTGSLLVSVELFSLLRSQNRIPLRKAVQPLCLSLNHIPVELLRVDLNLYYRVLVHSLDLILIAL